MDQGLGRHEPGAGQTPVRGWADTGQGLGRHGSGAGLTRTRGWADTYQGLGRHGSGAGQTRAMGWADAGQGLDNVFYSPEDSGLSFFEYFLGVASCL